jgi:hypothetical protein
MAYQFMSLACRGRFGRSSGAHLSSASRSRGNHLSTSSGGLVIAAGIWLVQSAMKIAAGGAVLTASANRTWPVL